MGTTENREVVARVYRAFQKGEVDSILQAFTADGEIAFEGASPLVPWHQPASGASLKEFFARFGEAVAFEAFDVEELVAEREEVVSRVAMRYRVRATGKTVAERQIHWWSFRGPAIARMTHFEDTAQVIAAVTQASPGPTTKERTP